MKKRNEVKRIVEQFKTELYGMDGECEITVEEINRFGHILEDVLCGHEHRTPAPPSYQMTEKQRKKISDGRKGYKMTEQEKERRRINSQHMNVYQYKDGKLIDTWTSTREAGRYGYNSSLISKVCRGVKKTAYGCVWRYAPIDDMSSVKVTVQANV